MEDARFPFDFFVESRLSNDSDDDSTLSISLLAQYSDGPLTLRLSVDPMSIATAHQLTLPREWIGFALSFIDKISLDFGFLSLDIGEDLIIPGDPFGVASAFTNSFQPDYSRLQFLSRLESEYYSHSIGYSDLRLEGEDGYLSYNGVLSSTWAQADLGLSLLARISHSGGNHLFYPEIYLSAPIITSGDAGLGMQFTTAFMVTSQGDGLDGWGMSFSVPLTFPSFSLDMGLAYTQGELQFGQYLNGYESGRTNDNTITLYSSLLYDSDVFDLVLDLQFPLDMDEFALVKDEDYFSLELGFTAFGLDFAGGVRLSGLFSSPLTSFQEKTQAFISMGYENEAISTTVAVYLDEERVPSITMLTSLNLMEAIVSQSGDPVTSPSWLDFSLVTGYSYNESRASLILRPTLSFNIMDDGIFALRLPLTLTRQGGDLALSNDEGDIWFDFGYGQETTLGLFYDLATDVFSLVDEIRLGGEDSPLYLIATRDGSLQAASFDHRLLYGIEEDMSLALGVNIASRASARLFIDDMEAPRLFELSVSVSPMGAEGPTMVVETLLDHRFSDTDFSNRIIPAFRMSQDLLEGRLTLSFYATTHIDQGPDFIDFHITSSEDFQMALGGRLTGLFGPWSFTLASGAQSGYAREFYYDSLDKRDGEHEWPWLEGMTPYLELGFSYAVSQGGISIDYRIDSFPSLLARESADRFRLEAWYMMRDFTLRLGYVKRDFVGGIVRTGASSLFDEEGVFSFVVAKTFGHLAMEASIDLVRPGRTESGWTNMATSATGSTSLGFSLITSLRF